MNKAHSRPTNAFTLAVNNKMLGLILQTVALPGMRDPLLLDKHGPTNLEKLLKFFSVPYKPYAKIAHLVFISLG
jgi:hypothetical protein